ncbi:cyclin-T [Culex quinquefasciatus]|uniref:cyclin-T n=1 Tax=Culex quinquefasciatus TaxID=7176 RepID=UPI0018E3979F|nr:cyclin-T [Culex quinquefasciatus]
MSSGAAAGPSGSSSNSGSSGPPTLGPGALAAAEGRSQTTSLARDDSKWYFTSEQLANSPSRRCGMDADQELMYRQRAANLIQDMGQRLQVSQLCINTAIVYMHRFYAFHSFTQFHRNSIAAAALFLAAKVEEQPRKLEHIIKVVHICLQLEAPDPLKESYAEQAQDLVFNENVLLQTLGFDVAIDHPHTHVVKTCHLVKASKDLAQTSYFMASNSLHLTTMCLQYKPTVVACFCIHLACKWSRWEIPQSNEGRHWFHYVDKTVTLDLLKQLTEEFLHIFDRCPTRLKSKMKSIRADASQSDDQGRRSASSSSAAGPSSASSSSIPRGIDDAGSSSSSSHHRSSSASHSQHSHSKQSSSSGDLLLKASQSGNHKIPSSSSSSSGNSRSRSDRPSASQSQQQQQQLHQQQQMLAKMGQLPPQQQQQQQPQQPPQPQQHRMPPTSSSSSSSSSSRGASGGYGHETGSRDSKGRMMPAGTAGAPPPMPHPYGQNKMDRQKGAPGAMNPGSKSSSSSMMASLFSNAPPPVMKQPGQQPPYGSHPPSYSQSMSGRTGGSSSSNNNSSESMSVPSQQQQQQFKAQQLDSSSSFRLIDDSNRIAATSAASDAMQLSTPPKQSKLSSIFSPDWKETTGEPGQQLPGKSRPAPPGMPGLNKPIKDSPSSREKKPTLPSYPDQQQQQKQRSDTPKKDRRVDPMAVGGGQKQKSSSSSSSLKRSLESMSAPALTMPGGSSTVDPTDLLSLGGKHPSASMTASAVKRSLTGSEQVRQEDGTDFRESKVRKVEPTSPTEVLFSSSFDLSNTFDKETGDSFSMFSFGDPGSLLSQPLLSDSKPSLGAGISSNSNSKSGFPSTINGIETNPALVSSLLKESLQQDSKFGILSSVTSHESGASGPMVSIPDTVNIKTEAPDMNAPATISSLLAPTTVASAASLTATNSDVLQTLTGDPLIASAKDQEDPHRIKTEKKKKKDKHKHKEKDKTKDKDREERKKHKKDKDRHRDKSDQGSDASLLSPPTATAPPGPIKIKLPKDKLNLPSLGEPEPGLKIKIPKDRLSGSGSSLAGNAPPPSSAPPNPLKLKISKDKIEHYNVSSDGGPVAGGGGYNNGSGHGHGAATTATTAGPSGSSGSHGHGHSSKKKDRDKERDKSKSSKTSSSSSSGDYSKQNGGGGGGSSAAGGSSNKSSSSKQSVPSSSQQQHPLAVAGSQVSHHPASFDYMQHAQAPSLLQQQQYFNQFGGAFNVQQQQQTQQQQQMQQLLMNNSAIKMPGTTAIPQSLYYGASNTGGGGNTGKK